MDIARSARKAGRIGIRIRGIRCTNHAGRRQFPASRRVMAVVAGDQSLCRDAGERRGPHCPLDRRTSPDRELVEEPHDRWLRAWPCSHMPCEIFVAHSAARDEQHALVWSDGREHPAHCAACVAFGVWWCGERCEDLGSVDFTASPSAVLARDRLGNCLGVLGSFRCAVVRGVLAEFGLVAKGRLSVASSPSHRSDPAPRSLFGPLGVCSAASAASCSSVSVHA